MKTLQEKYIDKELISISYETT